MKIWQLVETTEARYRAHVQREVDSTPEGDDLREIESWRPMFSTVSRLWRGELFAFALIYHEQPEHSQFFILEEVAVRGYGETA